MFEFDQELVETLRSENIQFRRLHSKHDDIKKRVSEANSGAIPLDDFALENLKKEKLQLKDQMATIISEYRNSQASSV